MSDAERASTGSTTTSGRPRLIYLELLDPLLDADGGRSRTLFRLRRDVPWALEEGWELERWGLWRPGQRDTDDGAGRRIGLILPAWVPAHPALAAVAWLVHLGLALTRPRGVAVAYNPFAGVGVAAASLVRRGPDLVVRVIARISSKALQVHGSSARARLLEALEWFVLRRAGLVVPMGGFTRQLAVDAGVAEERIVVLPCLTRWQTNDAPARRQPDGAPRAVAAGRFVPEKGFDVLLHAVAHLAQALPGVTLELAGDGPERPRLRQLAQDLGLTDRVRFHGWLGAWQLAELFGSADVAVLPSRVEEGLGMVLVEAGLTGCALVGSDLGGVRDIVQHGRTGLLVEPDDPAALADALRRLLTDRHEASRLGAGARTAALAYLADRDAAVEQLRGAVVALADGRRRPGRTPPGRWGRSRALVGSRRRRVRQGTHERS